MQRLILALWLATAIPAFSQAQTQASATDFDFLEGRWDIVYNNRGPNIPPDVRGTWIGTRQADGRVLYDEFRLFGPKGETVSLGLTYRIFDEVSKRWDMRYVGVINPDAKGRPQRTAQWAELTAWREGDAIRVDQRGRASQLRITYYNIAVDRFRWKADVSTDGGQTWNQDQIRIEARRAAPPAVASGSGDIRTQEVRWTVGGATLVGTLHLPAGTGPFPAMVFAPGSGSIGRNHSTVAAHAERLPRGGFAVLTFDKRGVGQSSGDWRRETLTDYAADVKGGVELLRADARIDRTRIGIIGHSQGGWTAPLAASAAGDVAFVVLVSATTLSPLEQSLFADESEMIRRGVPDGARRQALELLRRIYAVYRDDAGWEEAQRAIERARTEPWFEASRFSLQPKDAWNWRWLHGLPFDFDITPTLSSLTAKVLTINGSLDRLVPAEQSQALFEKARRDAGLPIKAVVIPNLHHGLGNSEKDAPGDAYWRVLLDWLPQVRER